MAIQVVTIKKLEKHPAASRLKVCQVSNGTDSWQVVCGAENARLDMKSIFAPIDSVTPAGLNIQKSNLRGEDSFGMLCSAKDLAISSETGIVDLPLDIKLGTPWEEVATEFLSSIPWYNYKQVDAFYQNTKLSKGSELIKILHGVSQCPSKDHKLISKTYFHNGQYLYRHFN